MKQFWIIVSLISLSLFTTNCTKEDWTPDSANLTTQPLTLTATIDDTLSQFLTYDYLSSVNEALLPLPSLRSGTTTDSLVEAAMLALESLDAQHGFIKNIVRKYGYPIWDRTHKNYDSRRKTVLFIPLAFAESTEVTAFFVAIPWKNAYRFRLVKKDQIVQAVEGKGKYKDWENLTFVVMEFFQLDLSLFDFIRNDFYSYLVDLSGRQGGTPRCTILSTQLYDDSD